MADLATHQVLTVRACAIAPFGSSSRGSARTHADDGRARTTRTSPPRRGPSACQRLPGARDEARPAAAAALACCDETP